LGSNPVAAVQYTFTQKQYTEQHNETEYNTYITIKIHKHKYEYINIIIKIYKLQN